MSSRGAAFKVPEWVPDLWGNVAPRLTWSRRWTWTAAGIAGALVVYLLAGFFLAPSIIRSVATDWVKTNLGKTVAIGDIRFNPITFTLDASDIAIPGPRQPMVSVGHLRVGVEALSSLFGKAYAFDAIRLERPYIYARIRPDGSLNLNDLVPRTKSTKPSPDVRIDTLSVDAGRVVFDDDRSARGLERTLAPITFTLKDFETQSAAGGQAALHARSELGERFAWTGSLSIAPIASAGHLVIGDLQSDTVQRLAAGMSPVALTRGRIGLDARYRIAYGKSGIRLDATIPAFVLSDFGLAPRPSLLRGTIAFASLNANVRSLSFETRGLTVAALRVALSRLTVRGASLSPPAPDKPIALDGAIVSDATLDYGAHAIEVGSVALSGADLPLRRDRAGKINLLSLLPPKPGNAATSKPAAPAWRLHLRSFALAGSTLRLDDEGPGGQFTLAPVNVSATNLGTDLSQIANIRFDTRLNDSASLSGSGTVVPGSETADLTFTLAQLPLRAFAGYLPQNSGVSLNAGDASASGTVHVKGMDRSAFTFAGDAAVDHFDLHERAGNDTLFSWASFALSGIDVRSGRVQIALGTLTRPFGRIEILPDRSFNYMALFGKKASAPAGGAVASVTVTPAPPAHAPPARASVPFAMKRLAIAGGTMSFADLSITPHFQARIDALQGTIANISGAPGGLATIDLKGHVVDHYSPVAINGTMDPFGYDRRTNLHMTFRNIELPIFNPYSDNYAGYAIAKGKLSTELTYTIKNRALQADHHIVVDQLEWGEPTASKQAAPFPVRLAAALLKDENGVIDLDIPVTGSLDDPAFSLGPIVWKVVGNIIAKAVTAPFRLIGSLFAGADKAQYIDFAPGSSSLPADAPTALDALSKALVARPALKLDIPAGPAIASDADGLADQRIDALVMADETKSGKPADVSTLDPDTLHDRLADLYREKFGKRPDYPGFTPDALKAASGNADLSDDDRSTLLETQWLRAQLRAKFTPQAAELAQIGTARAIAIRNALLANTAIDPARIFMATEAAASAADGKSRVELKFE